MAKSIFIDGKITARYGSLVCIVVFSMILSDDLVDRGYGCGDLSSQQDNIQQLH